MKSEWFEIENGANAIKERYMVNYQKPFLALALALCVGSVFAQDSGGGAGGPGGGNNSTEGTFQTWLNAHSGKNNGRVSRKEYMAESGRRWDSMDRKKQGLTTDEINHMYGPVAVMGGPTPSTPNEKSGVQQ